jgi:hypothetical protein
LRSAFRVWRLRIRLAIAAYFADGTSCRRCWAAWKISWQVSTAVGAWREAALRSSFEQLRHAVADDRRLRVAVGHWAHAVVYVALRHWLVGAKLRRRRRVAQDLAAAAVARWQPRRLREWLGRWVELVRREIRKRDLWRMALTQCSGAIARRGLEGWVRGTQHKQHQIRRLAQILVYAAARREFVALVAWQKVVAQKLRGQELLARALGRMSQRTLRGAVKRWGGLARDKARRRLMLAHALLAIRPSRQRRALALWSTVTRRRVGWARVLQLSRAERQRRVLAAWASFARAQREIDHRLKQAVCTMMNLATHAALSGWRDCVQHRLELRRKLQRTVTLLMNQTLHSAFLGWRTKAAVQIELKDKLQWTIGLLMNRTLHAAFLGWRANADVRVDNRNKMMKVVKMLSNRLLSHALSGWMRITDERLENRAKMKKAATLMLNIRVMSAFKGWSSTVASRLEMRDKLQWTLRLLLNRTLASAYIGWHANAAGKADNREKMMRVVKMMTNSLMAQALSGWMRITDERIDNREKMTRVLQRMTQAYVNACFQHWADVVSLTGICLPYLSLQSLCPIVRDNLLGIVGTVLRSPKRLAEDALRSRYWCPCSHGAARRCARSARSAGGIACRWRDSSGVGTRSGSGHAASCSAQR